MHGSLTIGQFSPKIGSMVSFYKDDMYLSPKEFINSFVSEYWSDSPQNWFYAVIPKRRYVTFTSKIS
jgi:ubiquitin C-terminal hydrolase